MGSFYVSCFASNQPIASGDKCFIFPVMQCRSFKPVRITERKGSTPSLYGAAMRTGHPDCYWQPAGGFLAGEYDDSGLVMLDRTAVNAQRLLAFANQLYHYAPVVEQDDGRHEPGFNPSEFIKGNAPELYKRLMDGMQGARAPIPMDGPLFDELVLVFEKVWEMAFTNRLFMPDMFGVMRPVLFSYMSKHSFDYLVDLQAGRTSPHDGPLDKASVFTRMFNELQLKAESRMFVQEGTDPAAHSPFERIRANDRFREVLKSVGDYSTGSYPSEINVINRAVEGYLDGKLDRDALFKAVEPEMDVRYVMEALEYLNVPIVPIITAPYDYDPGAEYAKFVTTVHVRVQESREED